jgi:hypothetical protein
MEADQVRPMPSRRLPCPFPPGRDLRQSTDALQREHIRSPKPSLRKIDLHLRQDRSAAISAVALMVPQSMSADVIVISAPRVFSIVPCRQGRA